MKREGNTIKIKRSEIKEAFESYDNLKKFTGNIVCATCIRQGDETCALCHDFSLYVRG